MTNSSAGVSNSLRDSINRSPDWFPNSTPFYLNKIRALSTRGRSKALIHKHMASASGWTKFPVRSGSV